MRDLEEGVVVEAGQARKGGVVTDGVCLNGGAEVCLIAQTGRFVAGVDDGVAVLL